MTAHSLRMGRPPEGARGTSRPPAPAVTEVGEGHGRPSDPCELRPALLGGAEVPLLLKAAEDHRPLGPSAALVLDRPRQRDQRRLRQPLRLQGRMRAAQRGIDRGGAWGALTRWPGPAPPRRSPPRGARRRLVVGSPADELDVLLAVAPVAAVAALRRAGSRGGTPTSATSRASGRFEQRGRRSSGWPRASRERLVRRRLAV